MVGREGDNTYPLDKYSQRVSLTKHETEKLKFSEPEWKERASLLTLIVFGEVVRKNMQQEKLRNARKLDPFTPFFLHNSTYWNPGSSWGKLPDSTSCSSRSNPRVRAHGSGRRRAADPPERPPYSIAGCLAVIHTRYSEKQPLPTRGRAGLWGFFPAIVPPTFIADISLSLAQSRITSVIQRAHSLWTKQSQLFPGFRFSIEPGEYNQTEVWVSRFFLHSSF